jgi:mono/diheme cytochrome c family protein
MAAARWRVLAAVGLVLIAFSGGVLRGVLFSAPSEAPARPTEPSVRPEDDITRFAHFNAPGMTQAQIGARVYDDWCTACHGDTGQGLTGEWRDQWDPEHQNCWQAKCHSVDHPSDGFEIPRFVPAVVGPKALGDFLSADDLYLYLAGEMPYAEKGVLDDQMYWALTAYILNRNGMAPATVRIGPGNAAFIDLAR